MEQDAGEIRDVLLTEDEVRSALEKAVRLERGGAVTVAELGEAAREVGISETALMQAVSEVLSQRAMVRVAQDAPVTPAVAERTRRRPWIPRLGLVLGGALAGLLGGNIGALGFALLAIAVGFRAFDHRRTGSLREYELDATLGWGSWAVSALLLARNLGDDALAAFAVMWGASAILGGLVVKLKRRPKTPEDRPDAVPAERP